jgi:hypothetical protein
LRFLYARKEKEAYNIAKILYFRVSDSHSSDKSNSLLECDVMCPGDVYKHF